MTETLKYKHLDSCLCCGKTNLNKILDLKNQPLANSYLSSKTEQEEYFPLALNYCLNCTHLQLTHAVNPDLLFKNYLYVSGTTKTLKEYFDKFVDITLGYLESKDKLNILDIACNDGSQLDSYKSRGYNTFGIDPAVNLYEISKNKHNIVCDYFTENSITKLGQDSFDIIVAQNVLAHNTYPKQFIELSGKHLSDKGKMFIQTSQADMVKYGQFDTIYHEHISFFNVRSMVSLLENTGLYLQDVLKTDIHGTSYVFVLSKNYADDNSQVLIKKDFANTTDAVEHFANTARQVVVNLLTELKKYDNHILIGYGAAAKGNTLLNFGEITLDYIVDDNPLKQNLYSPGRRIPIISLEQSKLLVDKPIVWIPLSWNFFNEIKSKVKTLYKEPTVFVKYFPELEVIKE